MKSPLLTQLHKGKILVFDGAMGTQLFARGLDSGSCPEELNFNQQDVLKAIAAEYLAAGADVIQTNTFGGSALKLTHYQLGEQIEMINQEAVKSVRSTAGNQAYVSGSCGPSGEILLPYGTISEERMYQNFHEQITILVKSGVDLICIETMTDLREAELALQAAKTVSSELPTAVTLSFTMTPRGFFTIMGNSIADCVTGLSAAGADILGSNCGNGLEMMIQICAEFRYLTDLPILIQSNAGLPMIEADSLVYPESPSFFEEHVPALIQAGANMIGGCCGTGPEHIRAIRSAVDRIQSESG